MRYEFGVRNLECGAVRIADVTRRQPPDPSRSQSVFAAPHSPFVSAILSEGHSLVCFSTEELSEQRGDGPLRGPDSRAEGGTSLLSFCCWTRSDLDL